MPGPLAGWKRVDRDDVKIAFHGDIAYRTIHSKCTNREKCTGAGCRAKTGKTRRHTRWEVPSV